MGKQKLCGLCENAPDSVQTHVDYVKENELHYSVATDASNKGTTKCFPIVLLDCYSDSNKTLEAIFQTVANWSSFTLIALNFIIMCVFFCASDR